MDVSPNVRSVGAFLDALEGLDAAPISGLLADDVIEVLPLNASGSPEPAAMFDGSEAVLNVQAQIVSAFSVVEFGERQVTESGDGQTVFVESRGRRVQRASGRVYENTYILKFEFQDGLIVRIVEYSNPVAFTAFFEQPPESSSAP